jgi:hypothetical protein
MVVDHGNVVWSGTAEPPGSIQIAYTSPVPKASNFTVELAEVLGEGVIAESAGGEDVDELPPAGLPFEHPAVISRAAAAAMPKSRK